MERAYKLEMALMSGYILAWISSLPFHQSWSLQPVVLHVVIELNGYIKASYTLHKSFILLKNPSGSSIIKL